MATNNPITNFGIQYYAGSGYTFACVTFYRTTSSRGRYPSPASLLRATRMQRKIARALPPPILHSYGGTRITPAAEPAPESNAELRQAVAQ